MATTAKSKTTKSTKTTKTKTVPAKKPATKPAGASVKPKEYKTVTSKTASKKSNTTKAKNTHHRGCEIFFGIIIIILAAAMIAGAVACFIIKPWRHDDTVMVESGEGNQIATVLTDLPGTHAKILIPKGFRELDDTELATLQTANGVTATNIKVAYGNNDNSVLIYLTESDETVTEDEVKDGINDLAKALKAAGITQIKTEVNEVDGHNVGTMQFSGLTSAAYPYQYVAFFSNNGKAASIAFGCKAGAANEWQKVGEAIIKSLTFTE